MPSSLEILFDQTWDSLYPDIELDTEARIISGRRFRFDYVHYKSRVAIEVNGGTFIRSGHSTGKGIQRDYEKNNLAVANGWVVFQLSADMINETWLGMIAKTIIEREG